MHEQVRNGLYIGSVDAAENLPGLKLLNITHVLQVRIFVPPSLCTRVGRNNSNYKIIIKYLCNNSDIILQNGLMFFPSI